MARKRLGEILLERGLIDVNQLKSALAYQRQWGVRLGAALVAKGFIAEGTLTRALAESLQIPMVDLAKVEVEPAVLRLLRASTCEHYDVFPIGVKTHGGRKTLLLAMADPLNVAAIDEIAFITDMTVRPAIAQLSSVDAAIKRYYHHQPVQIPGLSFDKPKTGDLLPEEETETMTIISRGGEEERVVGPGGASPVMELTDEVTDRHALAELEMALARRRMEQAQAAGQAPGAPLQDPFTGQPTGAHEAYAPQPTGAFQAQPTSAYMVMPHAAQPPVATPQPVPTDVLERVRVSKSDALEALEKKFWALMRVLAKRGLVTRDEFLEELSKSE